ADESFDNFLPGQLFIAVPPELIFPHLGFCDIGWLIQIEADDAGPDVGAADIDGQDRVMTLNIHVGAKWTAPMRAASSGSLRMIEISVLIFSALRMREP